MQTTTLKACLADGRVIEHSRIVIPPSEIAVRDGSSHIAALYDYWCRQAQTAPQAVPLAKTFAPYTVVPTAAAHMATVDVTGEDLSRFRAVEVGSAALGLGGFRQSDLNDLSPNGAHWALLLDLSWMKKDRQPVYVETELAVDGLPGRYVTLLLPLADIDGRVIRVHVVTRPISMPVGALTEPF